MHRTLVRALSALVVLLLAHPAAGLDPTRSLSQYVHRIWQIQQGLPQASIYAVAQGDEGYLWLGTQGGLVRFDGVRFTTIDARPLAGAWVQAIAEDQQHRLWVGTRDRGVFCVAGNAVTQYSRKQGLPSDAVRAVFVDRQGAVWVATSEGAARLGRSRFVAYGVARGLRTASISAITQAADGTIWLGGPSNRISVWNGAGFATYRVASIPDDAAVLSMLNARDGTLWIGTSAGLVHLVSAHERLYTVREGLAADGVLDLAESREGAVFAGTSNGFSRLQGDDVDSFRTEDGLSQSTVYALCEDREGSLWAGTKHGLNQFLDGRTIPFTTREGLPSNQAGPVLQDRRGIVWVGTLDAGLARFDGHRFTSWTSRNGLPSDTVRTLAEDRAGNLWVGTDRGLVCIHDDRVQATYTTARGLPANDITALLVDRGGRLWIGTSRGTTTIPPAARPLASPAPVTAFAEDARGGVYQAAAGSVYVIEPGGITRRIAEGLGLDSTTASEDAGPRTSDPGPRTSGPGPTGADALYADGDGRVWVGTNGNGLWLLDGQKMTHYSIQDGLFDDQIYGIVGDERDRLWMLCSKGVFAVDRGALLKFADGSARSFSSNPYSPTDALRTVEGRAGVQPAVWRMRDGRLWFSAIRGLIVIDPNRPEHSPPPRPLVEDVIVNGQREQPGALGTLAPRRNNLAFRYTAPGFLAPGLITFRYMLEGFDRDWTSAGTRREAFYTNLPHGAFRFLLSACNVAGTCVDASNPVAFAIAPLVYERAWFIPLCLLVAALAIWLAYQARVRRLRAQFAVVLAERARIARELHDTLIQGFSGIAMEMQALAGRIRGDEERTTLEEIIADAGTTLHEARQSLAGLRSGPASGSNLANAIVQTARRLTEGKDVRLKLRVDQDMPRLDAEVSYNLVRIAQEAITNAVVHSGAPVIDVALRRVDGSVELAVVDGGEGFDANANDHAQRGHYGLAGMRERAREIGASLQVTTQRGHGTTVRVNVPTRE